MPTDAPRIARRQPLLQFEVKRPAAREREQQIRYRDRRLLDLARVHGVLIAPAVLDDSHEARGRRPSRSSRHHLRDECRELSSQGRPPATDRGWKDPKIRDNQRSEEHTSEL